MFWLPAFFIIPRQECWKIARSWAYSHLWLQNKIIGSTFEFRNQENIPKGEPLIFASKHQSNWETYTSIIFMEDPAFILKRELTYLPLFGWYMRKMGIVPVDRGKRGVALASMTRHSKDRFASNRQIIIYPEGTRRQPWSEPAYKYGIVHLYNELGPKVLPVAVNSGLFWPKKSILVYPGKITMEFLPVIEGGLEKKAFKEKLEADIEAATNRLLDEVVNSPNPPPLVNQLKPPG